MRGSSTTTRPEESDEREKKYRNLATGIGQTQKASETTGARRSQCVSDATPPSQRACMDDSYPAPVAGGPTDCSTTALGPLTMPGSLR